MASVSLDAGGATGNQSVLMALMRQKRPAVSESIQLLPSSTSLKDISSLFPLNNLHSGLILLGVTMVVL